MSVQEYLSAPPPQMATRWMGMRRALLALALAAAVAIAGVAVTPFEVRSGTTTRLTVDINLARSIVANGSSWTFTPVLGQITVA